MLVQQDFQYPQLVEETAPVVLPQVLEVLVAVAVVCLTLPLEPVQLEQVVKVMPVVMALLAHFHLVLVAVAVAVVPVEGALMQVEALRVLVVAVLLG